MLDLSLIIALAIIALPFVASVVGKIHRYIPALIAAGLTIAFVFLPVLRSPKAVGSVLNLGQIVNPAFWIPGQQHIAALGVNWQTIVFIVGMIAMVES